MSFVELPGDPWEFMEPPRAPHVYKYSSPRSLLEPPRASHGPQESPGAPESPHMYIYGLEHPPGAPQSCPWSTLEPLIDIYIYIYIYIYKGSRKPPLEPPGIFMPKN